VSQVDVVNYHFQEQGSTRPISQKIFIILIKMLEALSDKELNKRLDLVVLNKVKTFQMANAASRPSENQ